MFILLFHGILTILFVPIDEDLRVGTVQEIQGTISHMETVFHKVTVLAFRISSFQIYAFATPVMLQVAVVDEL